MCEFFFKSCENEVSAIQNVIIMPPLLSPRHEMDKNRGQCRPKGEMDGLRKIRIKFSLIKYGCGLCFISHLK